MENTKNPKLSIIIASDNASHTIEDCLRILKKQTGEREDIEIIVADCSSDGTNTAIETEFPDVTLIHFPEKKPLPLLLGSGIDYSTGEIVAITDAASIADVNWVSEILKAHDAPYPVIGGTVEMAKGKSIIDWAAYFCDYSQFMHPLMPGIVDEIPGNNVSCKRWALTRGEQYVTNGFWKSYWCRRLQEEGVQLFSVPSIIMYCNKSFYLGSLLKRRFFHGRCFAGMRIEKISPLKRIFYIAGSPLLPFLFLRRLAKTMLLKKRYVKKFIYSFPVSLMAICSWSLGEFCGYLSGTGNSCKKIYIS